MDKNQFAVLELRISYLEEILLKDDTLHKKYLEDFDFLKYIMSQNGEENSAEMVQLMESHIARVKKFPSKKSGG